MNLTMKKRMRAVATISGMALASTTLALPAHAAPTASIAGNVFAMESTASVFVIAFKAEGDRYVAADNGFAQVVGGSYRIAGLEAGEYVLNFMDGAGVLATEYWANAPTLRTATPVIVAEGAALSGVDAELAPGGSIAGKVTGDESLANTDVTAYTYYDQAWQAVASAAIEDGSYSFDNLQAGTYRLEFEDYSGTLTKEYWNDQRSIESAQDVWVGVGGVAANKDAHLTVEGPALPPVQPPTPPMPPQTPVQPPITEQPPTVPHYEGPEETMEQVLKASSSLKVKGKARVGKKVRVITGPAGEVNYFFSWRANGKKIGHTYSYLQIPKRLRGKRLTVKVRVYNDAGSKTRTLKLGKVK